MKNLVIPLKYGSVVGIALIGYFLLLSTVGLHTQPIFSFMNVIITGIGIYFSIKKYKAFTGRKFNYQKGFMAGLITGFITTVIYTIFFAIYITELNSDFIHKLMEVWRFDWFANIGMLLLTVALMGLSTTIVLTLAFMQLFKDSWNTKEGKKHMLSDETQETEAKNH